jgi:hypothetical protein
VDFGPLRELVLEVNFAIHGAAATVTPPGGPAVAGSTILLESIEEEAPTGREYMRREPRRVMALQRDEFAEIPRGTVIVAPETIGGTPRSWQVDSTDATLAYYFRLIVIPKTD